MPELPRAERARSFGSVAEDYDRYRPGPPAAAVTWILPSDAADVLDLGAGTGSLSRRLLDAVAGVVASAEPDGRMRAVLARRSPRALPVGAVGEALPFASGSFDAVLVSSAWHWMDPVVTVPEIARVLRPGGRFGVLWNGPERSLGWVSDLLPRRMPGAGDEADRRRHRTVQMPAGAPFTTPETTTVAWSMPMGSDDLIGMAGTYSGVITASAPERESRLAEITARVAERITDGTVELPFACRCWRATRLS